jgi:acyl-CoA thioester hydrolase
MDGQPVGMEPVSIQPMGMQSAGIEPAGAGPAATLPAGTNPAIGGPREGLVETRYLTPLTRAELDVAGIPAAWPFGLRDRVRFSEIDALGHVNHTACLRWFESLRVLYMKERGISAYDGTGPLIVLKSVSVDYRAEMFLGEDYVVTARTAAFRRASLEMRYAAFAPDLRVEGSAVIVLLARDGSGKHPLSEAQKGRLQALDGAADASG